MPSRLLFIVATAAGIWGALLSPASAQHPHHGHHGHHHGWYRSPYSGGFSQFLSPGAGSFGFNR